MMQSVGMAYTTISSAATRLEHIANNLQRLQQAPDPVHNAEITHIQWELVDVSERLRGMASELEHAVGQYHLSELNIRR